MAGRIVIDDGNRLLDSNGNPVSGGKLRAYEAGTTTPFTLYTSASLSTAHTDPVVANSAGFLPQMWAADSNVLDVKTYAEGDTSYATPLREFLNVSPVAASALAALAATTGTSLIGHRRTGSTISRNLKLFLDDLPVSPEEFGATALEDGASATASQSSYLKDALESGRPVDGNGKTYVVGASLKPDDFTASALSNIKFVWATANQSDQAPMVDLRNQIVRVNNCEFDLGATEDTGATGGNADSTRMALAVGSDDPDDSTWVEGVAVTGCRVTGGGNGTSIYVRGTIGARVAYNVIYDRITAGSGITNDCQNGIDVTWGRDTLVHGNRIDGIYLRVAGTPLRQYSRGILVAEQNGPVISSNQIYNVDQGIDFSGGISAAAPNGNTGVACVANIVSDVRTWGIKHANCIRDSLCADNVVRNFGWGGIVVSGQSAEWLAGNADKATSYLTIQNNTVLDPSDYYGRTDCIGIWISFRAEFPGYPVGIRILDNTIRDSQASGRLLHGVSQDDGDGAHNIVSGAPYNEVRGNKVFGQTGTPTKGCSPDGVAILKGDSSQLISNVTWEPIKWNVETVDGENMHSNLSNIELLNVAVPGWYEVEYTLVFSANATGIRKGRVMLSGGTVAGGDSFATGHASESTAVTGRCKVYVAAGQNLRIEGYQSSGGALNVLRPNSQFSVRRLEQMGAA